MSHLAAERNTMPLPHLLTIDELFALPQRTRASISPDGTRIAYLAPWKGRLNVWVQDLNSAADACRVTADENRSVLNYSWTDTPRWLVYLQDVGGNENWHLYRIDLDAPDTTAIDLTPFPAATVLTFSSQASRPGKIVLQANIKQAQQFDLYEVDIASGELRMMAENPGHVSGWLVAGDGALYTSRLTSGGDIELSQWDNDTRVLRPVALWDGSSYPMGVFPMQLTPDGTAVWAGSNNGTDRTRLVRLDLSTGHETEIDSHPEFDLDTRAGVLPRYPSPLILDRRTGDLIGARYLRERQVIRPLNPHFAAVLKQLEALSSGDVSALSSDDSGQRWVVSFANDRDPGVTYFYDHSTGESRLLFRPYPHLRPEALAPMTPVTIQARDGIDLPSYLTLPVGIEPAGLPLILMIHGGPWTRDSWGYDPAVQLFANRGYAVLQVNFRGSTGFGKAFLKAAIGEFAGKMHDDLIDAVNWAVAEGFADQDRVAAFGGSYGGYAALVGLTFTPDVFAAAVDYVGISNLANFLRTVPPYSKAQLTNNWYLFVGDPDDPAQEADMLARSPISHLDHIRAPLLVVQGANDVRVVKAESDNLVEALRARGAEVEYLVFDNEGHMFVNSENLIAMFGAAEQFLAQHLGSRQ
ncbi:S9 family peptidase [Streptomyces sp. NPDC020571]|uniref:S9 family peptidase n=1 Tax=Streptomyces sp. NPDC020571 TaxID=3365079 RepID=UPI00378C0628